MTTPNTDALLDPDMPAQQLRLHMGELTHEEMRVARAAIRWANTRTPAPSVTSEELIKHLCCNTNLFTNDIEEAAQAILTQFNVSKKEG